MTAIITAFAVANLARFVGIWRQYRDFVSLVLVGLPFLILIDELWSLYSQYLQLVHPNGEFIAHLHELRWLRLAERSIAIILLSIFVIWNTRNR